MRASTILTTLCLLGVGSAKRIYGRDNTTAADTLIPNRFILQFSDVSTTDLCSDIPVPSADFLRPPMSKLSRPPSKPGPAR